MPRRPFHPFTFYLYFNDVQDRPFPLRRQGDGFFLDGLVRRAAAAVDFRGDPSRRAAAEMKGLTLAIILIFPRPEDILPYMPVISMFYGIIVSLYFRDNRRHKLPHIHVRYQDFEAVVSIPGGKILGGKFPPAKMRLVQAWLEIHKEELLADWELAAKGETPYKIEPLK